MTACGGEDTATVSRVIDGDTIEVNYRGNDATVRLLNIDTPETKHPNKQVECMGPEATEFLTELLPEGSKVTLEFDEEKTDKYDRLLAGVFTEDSTFVNEEIARNGFGNAIKIAPNEKFYPQILAAQEEATRNQVGLFDQEAISVRRAGPVIAGSCVSALDFVTDHVITVAEIRLSNGRGIADTAV